MEDGISGGLQHRHEMCCEKGGRCGRRACMVRRWFHHRDIISRQVDLYMTLINKQVLVREPVLQNTLVFLVKTHLKPVLDYSSEISHCKVDFHNVHVKLYWISMELETTLKQEIIELIRLSTAEGVRDVSFSSP